MATRYEKYKASYQAYCREHKDEVREMHRKWREKNPNYRRAYRRKHKDLYIEANRRWRKNNE